MSINKFYSLVEIKGVISFFITSTNRFEFSRDEMKTIWIEEAHSTKFMYG